MILLSRMHSFPQNLRHERDYIALGSGVNACRLRVGSEFVWLNESIINALAGASGVFPPKVDRPGPRYVAGAVMSGTQVRRNRASVLARTFAG
jgi:hypothetical protein